MSWLGPLFLSGLALVVVPFLIHWLSRRRRQHVPWGAMRFLTVTPQHRRRRWMRLADFIIMLLRMTAVAALVLAFAQPVWRSRLGRGGTDEEVVFILDASMSASRQMSRRSTVWELLSDTATRLLSQLPSSSKARVLIAADPPYWLQVPGAKGKDQDALTRDDRSRLASVLGSLRISQGGSDLAACVAFALQSEPLRGASSRRFLIISDNTAEPWHAEAPGRWSGLVAAATSSAVPTRIEVRDVVPAETNLTGVFSIDRLSTDFDIVAPGDEIVAHAVIRHHGNVAAAPPELIWKLDGQEIGRVKLPVLNALATTTVDFNGSPPADKGSHLLSCELAENDRLSADDTASVAFSVADSLPLLIVDGGRAGGAKPSAEFDETLFFLSALGQGEFAHASSKETPQESTTPSAGKAPFQPHVIAPSELESLNLTPYVAIVWANAAAPSPAAGKKLATHIASGAGLWLALGGRAEANAFNTILGPDGPGLLPLRLGDVVTPPAERPDGWRLLPPTRQHPATRALEDTQRLDIIKGRIRKHHAVEKLPSTNAEALADVLLQLETQAPILISSQFGQGQVLLQTVPFNRAWSSLPLLNSYVPLVREALWHVAAGRLGQRQGQLGDVLSIPLGASSQTSLPLPITWPDGKTDSLTWPKDGVLRLAGVRQPGIGKVQLPGGKIESFSLQRHPAESILTALSADHRRTLQESGVLFPDEASRGRSISGGFDTNKNKRPISLEPLSPWILALLPLLFVLERLLAWWLARRRQRTYRPIRLTSFGA